MKKQSGRNEGRRSNPRKTQKSIHSAMDSYNCVRFPHGSFSYKLQHAD